VTWILYRGHEILDGEFYCPSYEALQELPAFETPEAARAAYRTLSKDERNQTVILQREKLEALAAKRGMPAQPRQGLSPELEARMRELMAEKSCSRGWARHLARREFELAAATAALLKSDAS